MRIVHRISISSSAQVSEELGDLGIDVDPSGFVTFEVDETHPRWPELRAWVARRNPTDFVFTKFSSEELVAASWLEMVPAWHHGYPQPDEDSFGYLTATYDQKGSCERCGVGLRQVAPFQMKDDPKWGGRGILQLNWIFDEFFVTPSVYTAVFEPLAIECRRVTSPRGDDLEGVLQLVITNEVDIVTEGLERETCPVCERTKYLPVVRGPFPALESEPSSKVVKTRQWFGSGASAHRQVLVGQDVRQALEAARVRGVSFRPVSQG